MDQIKTGKFIAAMRRELGMTQRQLADALGICDKTVSKWETGKGMPEVGLMLPLCTLLGINANELLSGQRLTEETYKEKAEEHIVELLSEKKKNQRRIGWTLAIDLVSLALGFYFTLIAVYFEMPEDARKLLFVGALLVSILGTVFAYTVDRTTGYFQCGNCQELFVPDGRTYLKGAWSVLPGSGRLTCPHCGRTGKCRRKLGK